MNVRRRYRTVLLSVVSLLPLVASCGDCRAGSHPDSPDSSGAQDREPCRPLEVKAQARPEGTSSGEDALFVITSLGFGRGDQGLDLDCVDTPGGCVDDLCREGPDDGEGGVDNQLGVLASKISSLGGSDLQAEMTEAIDRGDHPMLLKIIGAPDLRAGGAEAVEISFGLDADGDPSDLSSGSAQVKADPAAPGGRPSRFSPVAISDGVLTAGPTTDWMPLFWTRGEIAAVPVEVAYLKLSLSKAPSGDPPVGGRITGGLLAGGIRPDDLSKAIIEMDRRTAKVLGRLSPVVRALIRGQSDLDLIPPGPTERRCDGGAGCYSGQRCRSGRCREPQDRFDSISFAIRFEAVSAVDAHLHSPTVDD